MKHRFKRGKMMDEFVVASEKYGSGSLERKYRFSAENGNLERIGRKREIISSFRQFFKVTVIFTDFLLSMSSRLNRWGGGGGEGKGLSYKKDRGAHRTFLEVTK